MAQRISAPANNEQVVARSLEQQALAALQAARDAATAEYQTLGTITGATFANNTQRDNAIRQLATTQRTLIVNVLDEMAKVERLLVRAVARQYDGAA